MRVDGIKTYEEANQYLDKYLEGHNKKFSVEAREVGNKHRVLNKTEKKELERLFAKEEERVVKSDGTISYNKTTYQLQK
jgi:hypothetical protein